MCRTSDDVLEHRGHTVRIATPARGGLDLLTASPADVAHRLAQALQQADERYRLVAENVADEDFLFHPDAQLLEALGHAVLEANAPGGALRAAGTHQDPIHLPLTDVIMPRMAVASCTSPLPRRDPATSSAPS